VFLAKGLERRIKGTLNFGRWLGADYRQSWSDNSSSDLDRKVKLRRHIRSTKRSGDYWFQEVRFEEITTHASSICLLLQEE
jgi:hypothetical protein